MPSPILVKVSDVCDVLRDIMQIAYQHPQYQWMSDHILETFLDDVNKYIEWDTLYELWRDATACGERCSSLPEDLQAVMRQYKLELEMRF